MKKILTVILIPIFTFVLAACSSTTPALTSTLLHQLAVAQSSFEGESKLKMKTNMLEDYSADSPTKLILQILEDGLIFKTKQQDRAHAYMKVELENPDLLQQSKYWLSENVPELEVYVLDQDLFFKTTSEDQFFYLNQNAESALQGVSQKQLQSLNTLLFDAFSAYIEQFDYELRSVENKGKAHITTPQGSITTNHIQVHLNLQDIKDFMAYALGNLAAYEQLDRLVLHYYSLLFSDYVGFEGYEWTEEEILQMVQEFKDNLAGLQTAIEQLNAEEFASVMGFKVDLAIELDFFVTDAAELVKSVMNFDLTLDSLATEEEPLYLQIEAEDVYWNVKGQVDLPTFDQQDVYDVLAMTYEEFETIESHSFVRQMVEPLVFPRVATIEIGSPVALVNHHYVVLEAPPYIKNGNTMVPVSIVTDIAHTTADWNNEQKIITFEYAEHLAVVQIGSKNVYVDDKLFELGVAPEIKNGIAFVPIRLITKHLGAEIYVYDELGLMDINY